MEKVFIHTHNVVVGHLITHYNECNVAFSIFDQFRPLINRDVYKEVQILMQKKTFEQNEYKNYVTYLNKFEELLHKVPNSIYFPLFDINLEKVKYHLDKHINEMRTVLLNRVESLIIDNMKSVCDRYSSITNTIRKSVTTAEEVETMEKYM